MNSIHIRRTELGHMLYSDCWSSNGVHNPVQ